MPLRFAPLISRAVGLCLLGAALSAAPSFGASCLAGGTYHSVSTIWFNDGNQGARTRVALNGVLFTRPLKETAESRWLGLQFQGLTLEVDGQAQSQRFFQVPFAVELAKDTGAWLSTHVNGPLKPEDRDQLLALYRTLHAPPSLAVPKAGLVTLERDSLGTVRIAYQTPKRGQLERKKLAYESLLPQGEEQALTESVTIEEDQTTLTEYACGFRGATGRSLTEASFQGGMTVRTLQSLAVAWDGGLAPPPGLPLSSLDEDPTKWPPVDLAWLYPPPAKTPLPSAEAFLAALGRLDQEALDDAALKALLFNNDVFLDRLQAQFRQGVFSKAFQENLLLRLGQTDAPQARALLVGLAADDSLTPAARFGSLMALRYSPSKIEPESLDALLDFSNLSNLSAENQQLADSALMVLGEVARVTQDSTLTSRLTETLSNASSESRRLIALNALANAGDEATVPILGDYLTGGSPKVRARAAQALGTIRSDAAQSLLASQLDASQPEAVRAAALEGLGQQSLEGSTLEGLTRFTAASEPLAVRRAALRALAAQKRAHPEVATTLKTLLPEMQDRESMETILRALYQNAPQ